ncbi:aminotransferase class I/II-fold pyridoxal phosphate-dependent enzyme [Streptomyces sp. NPDC057565]|uniref:aminotransferase class I/II-fold pyridoxal phosphate-dependent enzyme n=1 Tax=Streptomyces sp. NPDC057565 TaxID=3346169 RepID=UPI0036AC4E51
MSGTALSVSAVDLTQHEIRALRSEHNLADAHTHQSQSSGQRQIVASLPQLWYESEAGKQSTFEQRFIDTFFRFRGQHTALGLDRTLLTYAASISTVIAGMYLKRRGARVSLIEPCFDNLRDLLVNLDIELVPLPEQVLSSADTVYDRLAQQPRTEVVFLVDPNNPTGHSLLTGGRRIFEEVVRFCRENDRLLVLDLCFAAFALGSPGGRIDVYEILEASGVSYIAMEDTGKTWPVQDAKCALITASADIYPELYNIHTSVLLNVSPFTLNVLTQYIKDSVADGFASVSDVLSTNRALARELTRGTVLHHQEPAVPVSVAWFELADSAPSATELQQELADAGVHVLPGTFFFWSRPELGERWIRVALARDPEEFAASMRRLREVVLRHG